MHTRTETVYTRRWIQSQQSRPPCLRAPCRRRFGLFKYLHVLRGGCIPRPIDASTTCLFPYVVRLSLGMLFFFLIRPPGIPARAILPAPFCPHVSIPILLSTITLTSTATSPKRSSKRCRSLSLAQGISVFIDQSTVLRFSEDPGITPRPRCLAPVARRKLHCG